MEGLARPDSASKAELVRQAFEQFARGELSGVDALLTEETVARFPELTCHGRAEISARLAQEMNAIEGSADLMAVVAEGDDVLLRWRTTGAHTGPLEGVDPTGRPVTRDCVAHLVIREGRAVSMFVVADRMDFAISTGRMGPPGSTSDTVFKTIFNARTKVLGALRQDPSPRLTRPERPATAEPPVGVSNVELFRWALGRFATGDPSGIVAITTDQTVASFPEGTVHGSREIAARLEEEVEPFDGFAVEFFAIIGMEEHALARWRLTGTHRGPFDEIAPTGKPVTVDGCEHVVFRDGRLQSMTIFIDRLQFAMDLGMMAADGTATDRRMKAVFNAGTRLKGRLRGARIR